MLKQKLEQYNHILEQLDDFTRKNWEDNFTIEFTHDTTAIEGNTLTLIDTKMILEDGIVPKETTLFELDQIRGHADAWQYVKENVKNNIPLSENLIKDIHERVVPTRGVGGIYRTVPVYIRGAQHVPPNYKKVRELMKYFIQDMNMKSFSSVTELAAWTHAEFVKIHPFQDGNGRTARLMLNYQLMLNNYPPINIKKDNVHEYFNALEMFAIRDDINPFKDLVQDNIEKSLDKFINMYKDYYIDKSNETLFPDINLLSDTEKIFINSYNNAINNLKTTNVAAIEATTNLLKHGYDVDKIYPVLEKLLPQAQNDDLYSLKIIHKAKESPSIKTALQEQDKLHSDDREL